MYLTSRDATGLCTDCVEHRAEAAAHANTQRESIDFIKRAYAARGRTTCRSTQNIAGAGINHRGCSWHCGRGRATVVCETGQPVDECLHLSVLEGTGGNSQAVPCKVACRKFPPGSFGLVQIESEILRVKKLIPATVREAQFFRVSSSVCLSRDGIVSALTGVRVWLVCDTGQPGYRQVVLGAA